MHLNPTAITTFEGRRLTRAIRHARGCSRCRGPVERMLLATRVMELGTPWTPTDAEANAAGVAGLDAALRSARAARRWPTLAGFGIALAAAATVFLVVKGPPEFVERGTGTGRAVLRMFCSTDLQGLRELRSGQACPTGGKLAFAAGASTGSAFAALQLSGPEGVRPLGLFPVSGRPGAEAPLDTTPLLDALGVVEVTAAFASTPDAALAALRGERVPGSVVMRQKVLVEGRR
jgi:hypothetical protein